MFLHICTVMMSQLVSNTISGSGKLSNVSNYYNSPLFNAKVKNTRSHTPTTMYAFMVWCLINRLTPNNPYMGRNVLLTSKRCILYIYSTNIGTAYFKHALYSVLFSSKCSLFHNANFFASCIIHILYTVCAKI